MRVYTCTHNCMYVCLCSAFFCVLREWYPEVSSCSFRVKSGNSLVCGKCGKPLQYCDGLGGETVWWSVQGKGCAGFEKWLHCESLDNSQTQFA